MIGPPCSGHYTWASAMRDARRHATTFGVRYTVKRVLLNGVAVWYVSPA